MESRPQRWLKRLATVLTLAAVAVWTAAVWIFTIWEGLYANLPCGALHHSIQQSGLIVFLAFSLALIIFVLGSLIFAWRISRLVFTVWAAFLALGCGLWIVYAFFMGPTDCFADCSVTVLTWVDIDGDGNLSDGEPPLPGVRFGYYEHEGSFFGASTTDSTGRGTMEGSFAGVSEARCVDVLVGTPSGYRPTTSTRCETNNGGVCMFGFQPVSFPGLPGPTPGPMQVSSVPPKGVSPPLRPDSGTSRGNVLRSRNPPQAFPSQSR